MRFSVLAVLALLTVALSACGAAESGSDFVVTDSAGVEIVYSRTPLWRNETAWRLGNRPIVRIGVVEGPEEEQFSRITNAFRLSDGRVVAVNFANPPEIRVFSAGGRYERSMGEEGGGPGQFQAISFAGVLRGDTLVAHDWWSARLTYFDRDGRLIGTRLLDAIAGQPANQYSLRGMFGDGTFLLRPNLFVSLGAVGRGRAEHPLVRYSVERATLDTLVMFEDREYYGRDVESADLVLFGLASAFAAHGDRIYIGEADEFRIDVYDLTGQWVRSVRRAYERPPVTPADIDAERERRLDRARSDDERRRIRQRFEALRVADHFPAHGSRILVDDVGNLWVEHYQAPRDDTNVWSVFGPDGRFLGEISMPRAFRVTDVGVDEVLGVWTDEYDVPSVRAFALRKGG